MALSVVVFFLWENRRVNYANSKSNTILHDAESKKDSLLLEARKEADEIIKEKYGNEAPINGRFIGRVFYGNIAEIYSDMTISKTDDITSRILWLSGLENGVNKGFAVKKWWFNFCSYRFYDYLVY